jgi:hypothetical protein
MHSFSSKLRIKKQFCLAANNMQLCTATNFFVTRENFSILNARFILLSAYERSPQLNFNAH